MQLEFQVETRPVEKRIRHNLQDSLASASHEISTAAAAAGPHAGVRFVPKNRFSAQIRLTSPNIDDHRCD